jgi:hypothetical protein
MKKTTQATSGLKNNHHSLQGSTSTNLLTNSNYNIESNNVKDDDSIFMFILIIKLNNILKFDMLKLDICLLYTFFDKDYEMYS